jgi:3-ketoacyl-CoA synthase
VQLIPFTAALLALAWLIRYVVGAKKRVMLLDFAVYKPPLDCMVSWKRYKKGTRDYKKFSVEAIHFQERISQRNGLGEETYLPPGMHAVPPVTTLTTARQEAEMVLYGAVQEALDKTGLHPRQIDILVVNCSLFNPTPSLSAMIINHFKMRSNVLSYNLAGMGCSAGVIAVGLAQRLLADEPNSYALVVSHENVTQNWYYGDDRSMLIPNTLFRMGGAAIVLTNKPTEARRAKYRLEQIVRVHMGADDIGYNCVFQRPDDDDIIGVSLSKDLPKIAGRALTQNLTRLGPLVLPWSEKLLFAGNWVLRKGAKLLGMRNRVAEYVPDFKQAFDHFCLHAGGRAVIEGLGTQLGLSQQQADPSSHALYWYGNTSSSSLWYALAYIESIQLVKTGQRVWQVGFGSGFKCNSAVWRAMRPIHSKHAAWDHLQPENVGKRRHNPLTDESQPLPPIEPPISSGRAVDAPVKNGKTNGYMNGKTNGYTNGTVSNGELHHEEANGYQNGVVHRRDSAIDRH